MCTVHKRGEEGDLFEAPFTHFKTLVREKIVTRVVPSIVGPMGVYVCKQINLDEQSSGRSNIQSNCLQRLSLRKTRLWLHEINDLAK